MVDGEIEMVYHEIMVGWLMISFSSFINLNNHLIFIFLYFFTISLSLFIYEMVDLLEMVG